MDRQCGRQLYDRTCCAKQMWERLRRPMNTKQSLGRNPTSFCAQSWEAAQPAPTPMGTPCRCLGLLGEGSHLCLRGSGGLLGSPPESGPNLVGSGSGGLTNTHHTHKHSCFPCHSLYSLHSSRALTCLVTAVCLPLLSLRSSSRPRSRQPTTLTISEFPSVIVPS